jgi:phenylpropionate dioxygenase-like ring-hydroxylating dioxygenase large terminal subunit
MMPMTYVRNAWYVAAWTHDLVAERPVSLRVLDEPIVIWRNGAGQLTAFEDYCVHRLARLSLGRCEGERLRCMYHGWLYDRSGCVVEIPGETRVPSSARVRTYPVVERHSCVWVWMGDAACADQNLIPPVVGFDEVDSDRLYAHGQLDYAAEARLVNDNLLDLSHVSFLHAASFGVSEVWAREPSKITEFERGVRIERWIRGEGKLGEVGTGNLVDTYFRYEFYVPGVLMMTQRTYPIGTAEALKGESPDLDRPPEEFTTQAITPLTAKSTRYFYIMGRRRQDGETTYDMTVVDQAFAEDKMMIEAQQQNIHSSPNRRFMLATADRAGVLFGRLTERMARADVAPAGGAGERKADTVRD